MIRIPKFLQCYRHLFISMPDKLCRQALLIRIFFQYFLKLRQDLQKRYTDQMRFMDLKFFHKRIIDHNHDIFLIQHTNTDINVVDDTLCDKI